MNYYRKTSIIVLIIVCSFGAISFTWFGGRPFLAGNDTILHLNLETIDEYFYACSLNSVYGGADVSKFSFLLPLGALLKLCSFFGLPFSPSIFQKLLVYILFTFSGISAYFLFTTLRPESSFFARLFASSVYMFNFYFMWLWLSVSYVSIVYVFFPLILAQYIRGIEGEKGLSYMVVTALVWTVTVTPGYGKPFVVTNWLVVLSFLVFYVMTIRNRVRARRAVCRTLWLGGIWFALNMLWIIPLFSSFHGELWRHAIEGVSSWVLFRCNSVSIVDGMRFMGYYGLTGVHEGSPLFPWYGVYDSPLFVAVSFLVPILAFSSFILNKRDKRLIYFGVLTSVFLFFVKGPNPPLGFVNTFLFSHFNLSFIFRSSYQRFMGYVVLGSAILIASTIDELSKLGARVKNGLLNGFRGLSIALLFVCLVGILPHPLWTGSLYDQSGVIPAKRVEIPNYYYDAAEWLDAREGDFNVLPLPFPSQHKIIFSWDGGEDGYLAKYPFLLLSSKQFITNDFGDRTGSTLSRLIISGAIEDSSVLNVFNVRYIVFHRDTNWMYYGETPNTLRQIQASLNSINGLILERSFGEIDIYRNTLWRPNRAFSLSYNSLGDLALKLGTEEGFVYFRDDFEGGSLSKWTYVEGDWQIVAEGKSGGFSVKGEDNSSLGGPFLGLAEYEDREVGVKRLTTVGWFRFGEDTLGHFPFWLRVEGGETFYPVIAEGDGHFSFCDGQRTSNFPVDRCYDPDEWYRIEVEYDIDQGRYWVWIDDELVTPSGLSICLYESGRVVSSDENFTVVRSIAGRGGEVGATMWIDDVEIWDQESENLVSRYALAADQVVGGESVELDEVNPTFYRMSIQSTQPFILVFNEGYDQGWVADVNGEEYKPFNVFGFANGYLIVETGDLEITIEYEPQKWFYYGSMMSAITFIACLIYLTYNWTRSKVVWKRIRTALRYHGAR